MVFFIVIFFFFATQRIEFHGTSDSGIQISSEIISKNENVAELPHNSDTTYRVYLPIPSTPPSDQNSSRVCKVQYILQVSDASVVVIHHIIFKLRTLQYSRSSVRLEDRGKGHFWNYQSP